MNAREDTSKSLLHWYDANARPMPWRVSPFDRANGIWPDPYRIWLSEVMLQQTTVAAVTGYFHRFTLRWPDIHALAAAKDDDVMGEWAGLGYYARARNLLKCARLVSSTYAGHFPNTYDALLVLPGVGPYTAAAIASIAFDRPEVVVDGNVERVMARFFNVHTPLPAAKPVLKEKAALLTPSKRPGDYAQAVMDLGATICTTRAPACGLCPLALSCAAKQAGTASTLPLRSPKKPKPTRFGIVYLAGDKTGAWLLQRRPDKGLLGGMLGWPTSDWGDAPFDTSRDVPPFLAEWHSLPVQVRHTFTHFHLILSVQTAILPGNTAPNGFIIVPKGEFQPSNLPTVMRKAHDLWVASC